MCALYRNNRDGTFTDITEKAGGAYAVIPLDGGVRSLTTPFDLRLQEINRELVRQTIPFGSKRTKRRRCSVVSRRCALEGGRPTCLARAVKGRPSSCSASASSSDSARVSDCTPPADVLTPAFLGDVT